MNRVGRALCLLLLWAAAPVLADVGAIRIVAPPSPSTATSEVLGRLTAELKAAGFALDADHPEPLATCTVTDGDPPTLEVDVLERESGQRIRRELRLDPRLGPAMVALRAVELLEASLLELGITRTPTPTPTPTPPAPPPAPPPPPAPATPRWAPWSFAAGMTVVSGLGTEDVGAAVAPTLGLGWQPNGRVGVRLKVARSLYQPVVSSPEGRAEITRTWSTAELRVNVTDPGRAVSLSLRAGAGVHRLRTSGEAAAPFVSSRPAAWGALFVTGLALGGPLWHRLAWNVDLGISATLPKVDVRLAGATHGRMNAFGATGSAEVAWCW